MTGTGGARANTPNLVVDYPIASRQHTVQCKRTLATTEKIYEYKLRLYAGNDIVTGSMGVTNADLQVPVGLMCTKRGLCVTLCQHNCTCSEAASGQ